MKATAGGGNGMWWQVRRSAGGENVKLSCRTYETIRTNANVVEPNGSNPSVETGSVTNRSQWYNAGEYTVAIGKPTGGNAMEESRQTGTNSAAVVVVVARPR